MPYYLILYIYNNEKNNLFIKQMVSTGQLALSNYFSHVIIGMLAIQLFFGKLEHAFSIEFAIIYASLFSLVIVVFSYFWRKKYKQGPLEFLMRKITG